MFRYDPNMASWRCYAPIHLIKNASNRLGMVELARESQTRQIVAVIGDVVAQRS